MAVPKNFYNYFDVCKMEGIPEGTAKSGCNGGLDGIASMEALKPIGHLFKQFEKAVKGGMRKQYGILRSHYDYWKRTGQPPIINSGRKPKWKDNPDYTRLDTAIHKSVKEMFLQGIDSMNKISIQQVTLAGCTEMAILEYMQRRPSVFNGDDVK